MIIILGCAFAGALVHRTYEIDANVIASRIGLLLLAATIKWKQLAANFII